ncbi:oligoendopeptidase F [Candidatus Woesearchaeota archaeon CG11_big_fil_rev_8_21_14_0_20_43_8]|nr:MAG: oligoendopeptidase F [Candidatus Woesearchaeota archaeon CG11_big_fil_rev_8_21_14_0_20_43_8]PIO05405.1 MAG: oligoendopeptidase F [Candidatus Woesearchaeota archaeon CG08_land_8_20_14_0_20_43_7]
MEWDLSGLYQDFGEEYQNDLKKLESLVKDMSCWTPTGDIKDSIEDYLTKDIKIATLLDKLYQFADLTYSTDTDNADALKFFTQIEKISDARTAPTVRFQRWLASVDIKITNHDPSLISEHGFILQEMKEGAGSLLSEEEETVLSIMKNTGSIAWLRMMQDLTSHLMVDYGGEKISLPDVRNLAYDADPSVRKKAYEAELFAYPMIERAVAASLNSIKGEVISEAKMRGFDSPLEQTVAESRMNMKTLDALLAAIDRSLPDLRRYHKHKAKKLGKTKLPYFDLFAPLGESAKIFGFDEAKEYIVQLFAGFSQELSDFAKNAFDNRWLDVFPREGKIGGGFCAYIHSIRESRILVNFTGTYSDVMTLSHELGHAYHGQQLKDESILNTEYPMTLAETASIFCESILAEAAIKNATDDKLFLLDQRVGDEVYTIIDIYSRYLFETEIFRRRAEGLVSAEDCCSIMEEAQKKVYGDALDHGILHPYMWACKDHYYDADYNFYNFPYAFGQLFSNALFSQYKKEGSLFVPKYNALLKVAGKMAVEDVGKQAGIDLHDPDFWQSGIDDIVKEIDEFEKL